MEIRNQVVVVTGGGGGIGRALCQRFAAEGARAVVVADRNLQSAQQVAVEIGGIAVCTDVGMESEIQRLVDQTLQQYGQIDLFCSNAGIMVVGDSDTPNEQWDRIWRVNLMAHVYAARAVLPGMLGRGKGYLLQTASAAGLLTQLGAAPYAVTKHAAIGFAEWLSITYAANGIKVSCLCSQGVRTEMMHQSTQGMVDHLGPSAIEPSAVAEAVVQGLAMEQFLILPHPEVADYFLNKAQNYERWLGGMRKLQAKFGAAG